jgi:P27 family predicted phage terminase small subunit
MRGRKSKSTELKIAQGNPGKRKLTKAAATPAPQEVEEFPAPAHLSAGEREIWKREISRVGNLNLLRQSDMSAFEMYVMTIKRYQAAKAIIDKEGLTYTVESKHGSYTRKRPELDIERDCRRMMRDMQKEFGMTSISRIRAHSVVAATRQPEQQPLPLQGGGNGASVPVARSDSPLGSLRAAGNA